MYKRQIYHTGSVQVFVNISTGIVTEVTFTFAYFLYYYCKMCIRDRYMIILPLLWPNWETYPNGVWHNSLWDFADCPNFWLPIRDLIPVS